MFEKRSDLKKFLTVAETGTVLGAADRIAMTQPALSRAIARLEASFGGRLFERLPTGVRLTEFGATVADQARHVLREIETAEGRVRSALSGHSSGLRVSAGPTWMQAILPEVVARFHDAFPDVELRLHAMTFLEGIRLLVNGESDLHCGRIDAERHANALGPPAWSTRGPGHCGGLTQPSWGAKRSRHTWSVRAPQTRRWLRSRPRWQPWRSMN